MIAPAHSPAFSPTGFFLLRTARLPIDTLLAWNTRPESSPLTAWTPTALASARTELGRRLRAAFSAADIQEALFVASPSTCDEMAAWLGDPTLQNHKLECTLTRYLQRMAARATPFGLFAGCSLGLIADDTRIELTDRRGSRRLCQLDNGVHALLASRLEQLPLVRHAITYWTNSSLYRLDGTWRHTRTRQVGASRVTAQVAIPGDPILDAALDYARSGVTANDLASHIVGSHPDLAIPRPEADAYVADLIEREVLVTHLPPLVTGNEPLTDTVETLRALDQPGLAGVIEAVAGIRDRLTRLDDEPLGVGPERYRDVGQALGALGVRSADVHPLHVELAVPAAVATCSHDVAAAVARVVERLHRILPKVPDEPLRRFARAFEDRYGGRLMPLVEVLDAEAGIGFDGSAASSVHAPLLSGLPFAGRPEREGQRWSAGDASLLSRIERLGETGARVLALTETDLDPLAQPNPCPLPDAYAAVVALGHPDESGRPQIVFDHAAGPSGASMMGRFCRDNPELRQWVRTHLRREASLRPDAVFDEIVHLPSDRLGNVINRPVLREFEIAYLARSGAPLANQIPIADLQVSVTDGVIRLWSVRLDREVLARMSSMHDYSRGHVIYRFLCNLQVQGVTPRVAWRWGALETLRVLPRVVLEGVVVARARWVAGADVLDTADGRPVHEVISAVQRWRHEHGVPRFVVFDDGPAGLPVDLENPLSIESLARAARGKASVVFVEMCPAPGELAVHGPEGRFVHEIVIPYARNTPSATVGGRRMPRAVPAARRFGPGSEWLYLKWYAGPAGIDALLTEVVPRLLDLPGADSAVDRWFFLRFADPDGHLRLRLHGRPDRLCADITPASGRLLAGRGAVWKTQVDTYEREVERYGGPLGIELSEALFWHDSIAVLEALQRLRDGRRMDARWLVCLRGWDGWLSDLGFNLDEKIAFCRQRRAGLAAQVGEDKALRVALGERFRRERGLIDALFDKDGGEHGPEGEAVSALRARAEDVAAIGAQLRRHRAEGRLTASIESLAASYLHLHANRMLRSAHARQEFVLYDFLLRRYESERARAR